jgi:hypothetical protein
MGKMRAGLGRLERLQSPRRLRGGRLADDTVDRRPLQKLIRLLLQRGRGFGPIPYRVSTRHGGGSLHRRFAVGDDRQKNCRA